MLRIRLARKGRTKRPFFRIVLTEHSKPVKTGFKKILGWHDPVNHETNADIEETKRLIGNGAKPSNRVARLMYNYTNDDFFYNHIDQVYRERTKKKNQKK